eukprot:4800002-Pleurochrysis_carterae.AAC.2
MAGAAAVPGSCTRHVAKLRALSVDDAAIAAEFARARTTAIAIRQVVDNERDERHRRHGARLGEGGVRAVDGLRARDPDGRGRGARAVEGVSHEDVGFVRDGLVDAVADLRVLEPRLGGEHLGAVDPVACVAAAADVVPAARRLGVRSGARDVGAAALVLAQAEAPRGRVSQPQVLAQPSPRAQVERFGALARWKSGRRRRGCLRRLRRRRRGNRRRGWRADARD